MRHHNTKKKFGRVRKQRTAFLNALVRSLIINKRIETTEARAKSLRVVVEKLVTRAKTNDLASRRLIASRLNNNNDTVVKLIDEIAPKYKKREGGYTRIVKLPRRSGDASPRAVIEFV